MPNPILAAFLLVVLSCTTRLPSLLHPQPIENEAVYSVVERKTPLLFWTYAAIFETFGKFNSFALHAAALVWTFGTSIVYQATTKHAADSAQAQRPTLNAERPMKDSRVDYSAFHVCLRVLLGQRHACSHEPA